MPAKRSKKRISKHIFVSLLIHLSILYSYTKEVAPSEKPSSIDVEVVPSIIRKKKSSPQQKGGGSSKNNNGSGHGNKGFGKGIFQRGKEFAPGVDISPMEEIKYKYHSFFERVHEKLDIIWVEKVQKIIIAYYKEKEKILKDRKTRVYITLNSKGEVINVKILLESGIKELDEAALKAFKESVIFNNPPKDLIKDGIIEFDWDFILY